MRIFTQSFCCSVKVMVLRTTDMDLPSAPIFILRTYSMECWKTQPSAITDTARACLSLFSRLTCALFDHARQGPKSVQNLLELGLNLLEGRVGRRCHALSSRRTRQAQGRERRSRGPSDDSPGAATGGYPGRGVVCGYLPDCRPDSRRRHPAGRSYRSVPVTDRGWEQSASGHGSSTHWTLADRSDRAMPGCCAGATGTRSQRAHYRCRR